jgi:hypothetical protein
VECTTSGAVLHTHAVLRDCNGSEQTTQSPRAWEQLHENGKTLRTSWLFQRIVELLFRTRPECLCPRIGAIALSSQMGGFKSYSDKKVWLPVFAHGNASFRGTSNKRSLESYKSVCRFVAFIAWMWKSGPPDCFVYPQVGQLGGLCDLLGACSQSVRILSVRELQGSQHLGFHLGRARFSLCMIVRKFYTEECRFLRWAGWRTW